MTDNNLGTNFKKGEKVMRLMSRYNPQLGMYFVFDERTITRVNAKSISCDDNSIYDKETGMRKGPDKSIYGSSEYEIMSIDFAKNKFKKMLADGKSVRGPEILNA